MPYLIKILYKLINVFQTLRSSNEMDMREFQMMSEGVGKVYLTTEIRCSAVGPNLSHNEFIYRLLHRILEMSGS